MKKFYISESELIGATDLLRSASKMLEEGALTPQEISEISLITLGVVAWLVQVRETKEIMEG